MKRRKNQTRKNSFFLIGGLMLGIYLWLFPKQSKQRDNYSQTNTITPTGSKTASTLNALLPLSGYSIQQAINWYWIANMETAGFSSDLFTKYKNPWGMKQPQKRSTESVGENEFGFATYTSIENAVDDLILYLKEFNYPSTFASLDDQLVFMKSKAYFEESLDTYRGLVIAWKNRTGN